MSQQPTLSVTSQGPVVTLGLNRPAARNALDEELIVGLTEAVVRLGRDERVRVIVITGDDDAFCAGTDVAWMEHLAATQTANDARLLANLLHHLRTCPKPTIAKVAGATIGAGVALAVACDIVVSAEEASFALPAVHLGAVPAVIGPFMVEAMGIHQFRRYSLTGETFSGMEARRLGVAHAVCLGAQLDATTDGLIEHLLRGGPIAQRETKSLINAFGTAPVTTSLLAEAAKVSTRIRRSPEAKEGLRAYIEKRPAAWRSDK